MATRPTFRLLWRRPLARLGLLALLLAGAATWYVAARGGWVNALHLPPVLDASTPRSQNGFTLEDIQTPEDDGRSNDGRSNDDSGDAAVLLIRPSAFPNLPTHYQTSEGVFVYGSSFDTRSIPIQASAQTSNGDVTPLNWKIIGTQAEPQFYRVEVPGGYSSECRYITVTLVPGNGPFPRWRITRLPNMRHAIPDAPQVTDSVMKAGITTTAVAWRGRHRIFLRVRPILPPNSHQWDFAANDRWSEWESHDRRRADGATTWPPILSRGGVFTRQDTTASGIPSMDFPAPYRSASRYVRADCELRQFETYDEQVTFHDLAVKWDEEQYRSSRARYGYLVLPRTLTATTSSGIVVRLPAQGQGQQQSLYASLSFLLSTKPKMGEEVALPNSPLARTFGKPVNTHITFAPDYSIESEETQKGVEGTRFMVNTPRNPAWHPTPEGVKPIPFSADLPPVLKDFTVILHQRVDLQTIPMTFTVPVSDTPPPDVH